MKTLQNNIDSKKKVTITATDRIGRTESITMILPTKTADRLNKADFAGELDEIYDRYIVLRDNQTAISKSQFYKLRDFYNLIYHKFYNYTLSVDII